uniref:ATP synthase F0 subunit 8 n=1 Tax=Sipunculus nudus TaxID=6446 RepID=B8XR36_SIPNU|nr:ATP synthase F0 subunit 8 [Sipunculus nudus]ACJ11904.1 ATP synthase F0 subunit 8 [Sipunculus nudus]
MPHLAPMSWVLITIMFWTCFLMLISMTWWQQSPKFEFSQKVMTTTPSPKWSW